MTVAATDELLRDATLYIWWEKPVEAVRRPIRVVAQVMNLGDYDDVLRMIAIIGLDPLREAILSAEPGWFTERSWHYWCYRLGITAPGAEIPPMPTRNFQRDA